MDGVRQDRGADIETRLLLMLIALTAVQFVEGLDPDTYDSPLSLLPFTEDPIVIDCARSNSVWTLVAVTMPSVGITINIGANNCTVVLNGVNSSSINVTSTSPALDADGWSNTNLTFVDCSATEANSNLTVTFTPNFLRQSRDATVNLLRVGAFLEGAQSAFENSVGTHLAIVDSGVVRQNAFDSVCKRSRNCTIVLAGSQQQLEDSAMPNIAAACSGCNVTIAGLQNLGARAGFISLTRVLPNVADSSVDTLVNIRDVQVNINGVALALPYIGIGSTRLRLHMTRVSSIYEHPTLTRDAFHEAGSSSEGLVATISDVGPGADLLPGLCGSAKNCTAFVDNVHDALRAVNSFGYTTTSASVSSSDCRIHITNARNLNASLSGLCCWGADRCVASVNNTTNVTALSLTMLGSQATNVDVTVTGVRNATESLLMCLFSSRNGRFTVRDVEGLHNGFFGLPLNIGSLPILAATCKRGNENTRSACIDALKDLFTQLGSINVNVSISNIRGVSSDHTMLRSIGDRFTRSMIEISDISGIADGLTFQSMMVDASTLNICGKAQFLMSFAARSDPIMRIILDKVFSNECYFPGGSSLVLRNWTTTTPSGAITLVGTGATNSSNSTSPSDVLSITLIDMCVSGQSTFFTGPFENLSRRRSLNLTYTSAHPGSLSCEFGTTLPPSGTNATHLTINGLLPAQVTTLAIPGSVEWAAVAIDSMMDNLVLTTVAAPDTADGPRLSTVTLTPLAASKFASVALSATSLSASSIGMILQAFAARSSNPNRSHPANVFIGTVVASASNPIDLHSIAVAGVTAVTLRFLQPAVHGFLQCGDLIPLSTVTLETASSTSTKSAWLLPSWKGWNAPPRTTSGVRLQALERYRRAGAASAGPCACYAGTNITVTLSGEGPPRFDDECLRSLSPSPTENQSASRSIFRVPRTLTASATPSEPRPPYCGRTEAAAFAAYDSDGANWTTGIAIAPTDYITAAYLALANPLRFQLSMNGSRTVGVGWSGLAPESVRLSVLHDPGSQSLRPVLPTIAASLSASLSSDRLTLLVQFQGPLGFTLVGESNATLILTLGASAVDCPWWEPVEIPITVIPTMIASVAAAEATAVGTGAVAAATAVVSGFTAVDMQAAVLLGTVSCASGPGRVSSASQKAAFTLSPLLLGAGSAGAVTGALVIITAVAALQSLVMALHYTASYFTTKGASAVVTPYDRRLNAAAAARFPALLWQVVGFLHQGMGYHSMTLLAAGTASPVAFVGVIGSVLFVASLWLSAMRWGQATYDVDATPFLLTLFKFERVLDGVDPRSATLRRVLSWLVPVGRWGPYRLAKALGQPFVPFRPLWVTFAAAAPFQAMVSGFAAAVPIASGSTSLCIAQMVAVAAPPAVVGIAALVAEPFTVRGMVIMQVLSSLTVVMSCAGAVGMVLRQAAGRDPAAWPYLVQGASVLQGALLITRLAHMLCLKVMHRTRLWASDGRRVVWIEGMQPHCREVLDASLTAVLVGRNETYEDALPMIDL